MIMINIYLPVYQKYVLPVHSLRITRAFHKTIGGLVTQSESVFLGRELYSQSFLIPNDAELLLERASERGLKAKRLSFFRLDTFKIWLTLSGF